MVCEPWRFLEEKGDLAILVLEVRALNETFTRLIMLLVMVLILCIVWNIGKWRPRIRGAQTLLDSGSVTESKDEVPQDEPPPPPQAPTPATPPVTTATAPPWLSTDVPLRRRNREVTPIVSPSQIDECARTGHPLLPGRNDAAVWVTCKVCRTHCSWGRREVATFENFPRLATVLRKLWAGLRVV
jgi:hypothetical protein